jgi:NTE family protein
MLTLAIVTRSLPAQQPAAAAPPASVACTLKDARPTESLALVLSGGGAHGIAHIGVLEVLDSLGIRPSLVVGTSIGALVGALYAGGMSGKQLDSLVRRLPLEELFRRYPPVAFITGGDLASPIVTQSPAFVVEQAGAAVRLQSPAARERQVNALFGQLLFHANVVAGGDFARLPTPFVAVATDMRTRAPVVLRGGDLAQAVRASAAIPIVFAPVAHDDHMLIDGGLSANVPVDVARAARAARLIVSDVGSPAGRTNDVQSTTGMLGYLLDFLFTQAPYTLAPGDVGIRPAVDAYGPLSFAHAAVASLRDAGYRAAQETFSGCPVTGSAPPRRTGEPATNDERRISDRLARLMNEGVYESVWLNPARGRGDTVRNLSTSSSSLTFAPVASVAPGRFAGVALAYDNHEGVRAALSSASTALAEDRIAVSGVVSVGEWRQQLLLVAAGLRRHSLRSASGARPGSITERLPDPRTDQPPWSMLTRDLMRPAVSLTGTRETVRLYDDAGHELARPATRDLIGFAGASATFSGGWQGALGPVEHVWWENATTPGSHARNATGALVRAARLFAVRTNGPDQSSIPAIAGELLWTNAYHRALVNADVIAERRGFQLRARGSLGAGRDLPLSSQLALGGSAGFPGLMTGERRGDRAAFVSAAVSHALIGPLYWRVDVGRGKTRLLGDSLGAQARGWITGADAGLAADTPLGPLTISYGVSTDSRRVFRLRLGP